MKNHLVFSAKRGKEVIPDSIFAKYYAHHLITSIPSNASMQVKQRSLFHHWSENQQESNKTTFFMEMCFLI